jgi:hypothetical protein
MKKNDFILKVVGGEEEINNLRAEICGTMKLIEAGEDVGLDYSFLPDNTIGRLSAVSTIICRNYINQKVEGLEHLSRSQKVQLITEFTKYVLSDIMDKIADMNK